MDINIKTNVIINKVSNITLDLRVIEVIEVTPLFFQ